MYFTIYSEQIIPTRTRAEWVFGSLDARKFSRVVPKDTEGLIIRETDIVNVHIHWKSMAEMFIPQSLFESTMFNENQIFDAISLEDLRSLMNQYYTFILDPSLMKIL